VRDDQRSAANRAARRERYDEVVALHQCGLCGETI
ncbi:MAG: hypothetical protein AVDCRST_MAG93-7935, partial [uncultured Chloroflexia bacterium]